MNGEKTACHCDEGWICEKHPDKPWPHRQHEACTCGAPHYECPGPGMPCKAENCPYWRDGMRLPLMDGSPCNWIVSR